MIINYAPISVIIPCYCCETTIQRAIESVMRQTILPREVWLIEDSSPDDGLTLSKLYEIQEKYGGITKIEIVTLKQNSGPSIARNIGWESSNEPYIAFLDADDSWHSCKLEIQYHWMLSQPSIVLTSHQCIYYQRELLEPQFSVEYEFKNVNPRRLLFSNYFLTPSVMLRRDIPYRFDATQRYAEDYSLWLNIALTGYKTAYLSLPLAYMYKANFGKGGLSANLWHMEIGELKMYFNLVKLNLITFDLFILAIFFSIMKYLRRVLITNLLF